MSRMVRAGVRFGLLPVLVYAIAYAALTWPALTTFSRALLCDEGDGYLCYWNLWWIKKAILEQGTHPWFTDQLYWPHGVTLIGQALTPFNGLTGILLAPFLNPVQAHNTLIVAAFVLGGLGCFLLAWHLSRCYQGSLFAGAAFTFSHYHFAHALGHMQLVTLQWVPFFVLAFVRFLESGGVARGAVAALCLLLVALSDFYYTMYSVMIGAVLFVAHGVAQRAPLFWLRRPHAPGVLVFVVLACATAGALAGGLLWAHHRDPFIPAHDATELGMDPFAPFVPGGSWRFHEWTRSVWEKQNVQWIEGSVYLGWVPILAAIAGVALAPRDRRRGLWVWVVLAVVFYFLALGPRLHVFGKYHPQVSMPYRWLEAVFPPIKLSGVPVRMAFVTLLCTVILAAHGLLPLLRRVVRRKVLWPVVLGAFVFEIWPRPQVTTEQPVPETVWRLADLPMGAVHGWCDTDELATYALWHQTVHEKPMTWAYVSRIPVRLRDHIGTLRQMEREHRFAELMDGQRIRYLVRATAAPADGELERACQPVWRGREWTIWVRATDPLATDVAMQHALAGPHVTARQVDGPTVVVQIDSPLDAGAPFSLLASQGRAPATPLGGSFVVDLADDALFAGSLQEASPYFAGNHGRLDALGRAEVRITIPEHVRPSLGQIHLAAVRRASPESPLPRRLGPVTTLILR